MGKNIQNLKIGRKLHVLVGVALVGMLLIGGMSFSLMGRLNEMTSDISTSWLPSVDTARAMDTALSNIRFYETEYLTALSSEDEQADLQHLQTEKETVDVLFSAYGSMIDQEEETYYNTAMEAWNKYNQANDRMMSLAAQGNTEQARNILEGECEEFYSALHTSLGNIIAYNTEGSEEATQESIFLYRIALLAQGAVMVVTIIIGVYFSVVIIRGIKLPIFEIQDAVSRMQIFPTSPRMNWVFSPNRCASLDVNSKSSSRTRINFWRKWLPGILPLIPAVRRSTLAGSARYWILSTRLRKN